MKTKKSGRSQSNPIEHFSRIQLTKDMPFATLVSSQKCQILKKRSLDREDDITTMIRVIYTLRSATLRLLRPVPSNYVDRVLIYKKRQRANIVACCSILCQKLVSIANRYIDWQTDVDSGKDDELPF